MLFRKKMPRSCLYCANGTRIDDARILCTKCGAVDASGGCRKFRYDPCKRIPLKMKPVNFRKYDKEDFSL